MVPDVLPTYPSLLEPSLDPGSLKKSILRLNEVVEMVTGQRGKAEYSLQEGMLAIRKSLNINGKTIEASIREINETLVTETTALAQRTTIIEAEIDDARAGLPDLAARITSVDTARIDGDTALATSVNTVQTQVDDNVASIATIQTSIDGVEVRYGVMGYINGATGGFVFTGVLQNDGSASYNMEFYSNVIIHGDLFVDGSVSNPKITDGAVSNQTSWNGAVAPGASAYTAVTVRPGASVLITFTASSHGAISPMGGGIVTRGYNIFVDGVPYTTYYSLDAMCAFTNFGGGSFTFYSTVVPTSGAVVVYGLSGGAHGFLAQNPAPVFQQMSITATELSK